MPDPAQPLPLQSNDSIDCLSDYTYTRKMGAYRPHFAGVPEDYYPLTKKQIALAVLILVMVIGLSCGLLAGFIRWVETGGLQGYVIVWVTVLLVSVAGAIVGFYFGGRARRGMEKKLIAENNRRQREMMKNGKK